MIEATVGTRVSVTLPYSEVCMSMRVAGKEMTVDVLAQGAQIIDADGRPFSFPISHGEAGIIALDA